MASSTVVFLSRQESQSQLLRNWGRYQPVWRKHLIVRARLLTELYEPFKTFGHPALDLCLPTKVF